MKRLLGLVALLAGLSPASAYAGPLGPKKPSELVTLEAHLGPPSILGCDAGTSSPACTNCPGANPDGTTIGAPKAVEFSTRIMPDGSESTLIIPDGYVLVVTSFDWGAGVCPALACSTPSVTTGTVCPYGYGAQGGAIVIDNDTDDTCTVVTRGTGPLDGTTHAGGAVDLNPGVVIKKDPNVKLCLRVNTIGAALPSNYGSAHIHGYLTKDK